MKKILTGAFALLLGTGFGFAENLPVTITETTPADSGLGLRAEIDYKTESNAYGESYPNFWVQMSNFNSTKPEAAADGEKVYESGTIAVTITGPNGYSYSETLNTTPGFPAAESHAWSHAGVIKTGGTYDLTAVVTMKYVDTSKEAEIVTFKGTFEIPTAEAKMTLNGTLANSQGKSALINYTVDVVNFEGDPLVYSVELYDNLDCTGTPVQTATTAAGSFTIEGLTADTHYAYAIKATCTSGDSSLEGTKTFEWTQTGILPTIEYTLTPTLEGCDFNYTVSYGDYAADEVESVVVYLLQGGQSEDNCEFKGEGQSGTIVTTFDGDGMTVWMKARLNLKDGTSVHVNPYDQAFGLTKKQPVYPTVTNLTTGTFVRTGSTSGTLPYSIVLSEDADMSLIDHFVVWASRIGDENMDVTNAGKDLNGVLTLTTLPSETSTGIWPKVKIVYTNGKESATFQTNCEVNTNEAEQPMTGSEFSGTKTGTATYDGTEYPYAIDWTIVYNEDKTLTIGALFTFNDGTPVGLVPWANVYVNGKELAMNADGDDFTLTTTDTYEAGTKIEVRLYRPYALNAINETVLSNAVLNRDFTSSAQIVVEEDSEVVYYTLQGVRVENPTKGIYVRVAGKECSKVIIK